MGEGLLLGLSWLDGSVSSVLSERKVVKVSSIFRCLSNHVEVNFFYLLSVWFSFVFICSYKASGFLNIFGYYCEYCLFCGEDSFSFSLFFVILYAVYVRLFMYLAFVILNWVCWVRGNFLWRAGSYIFCVCDFAVWSAGPVQCYSGTFLERMAGLYRFFLFSGSVVAGTVRLNW
jgi:hypothetical protein